MVSIIFNRSADEQTRTISDIQSSDNGEAGTGSAFFISHSNLWNTAYTTHIFEYWFDDFPLPFIRSDLDNIPLPDLPFMVWEEKPDSNFPCNLSSN